MVKIVGGQISNISGIADPDQLSCHIESRATGVPGHYIRIKINKLFSSVYLMTELFVQFKYDYRICRILMATVESRELVFIKWIPNRYYR